MITVLCCWLDFVWLPYKYCVFTTCVIFIIFHSSVASHLCACASVLFSLFASIATCFWLEHCWSIYPAACTLQFSTIDNNTCNCRIVERVHKFVFGFSYSHYSKPCTHTHTGWITHHMCVRVCVWYQSFIYWIYFIDLFCKRFHSSHRAQQTVQREHLTN